MKHIGHETHEKRHAIFAVTGQAAGAKRVLTILKANTKCHHEEGAEQCDRCLLMYDLEVLAQRTETVMAEHWKER